ncbi:low-density lipoprotein receptor-related protein-like [Mercenaria mercenaria]|uniref:low-density lipoprotein receptor-related protein-like n=1 Tax=Mercenaria mercenaria TaxID=6596 RepID=UPI00234F3D67|nr:low-density lipoprotein receptor-related protein-like [Mercenaria mercenaria]
MEFQQCVVFFIIIITMSNRLTEAIPDKSVIWAAHEELLFYSPQVEQWTNAKITPTEFGQTITPATLTGTQSVYGLAGDIPTRHLVSSDRKSQRIVIYDLDDMQATFFHMGTSKDIGQLAIDWLGRNVYWADTGYGWIAMKKLPAGINQHNSADPNFRLVVDTYLEKPTGIVVHPEKYFLFWTDTGSTRKIERSDLIGGKRKIIIWHSLITPTTLCIDQSVDRLYWSDPARGTIEYSDFDGNGRKILLSDPNVDYYGIAVFQDSLIYTAPSYNRTGYVSLKENNEGEHIQASIQIQDLKFYQIMVYASELQEKSSGVLCENVQECSQICLHMEQDAGFTCLCDDGYELSVGRNCLVDERVLERHILFTSGTNICAVPISVLGLPSSGIFKIHCDVVTNDTVITRFSVDMTKKMIFYTNGTAIFKQTAFQDNRVLLYDTDKTIADLDYDWKTGQLYWIESADGNLYHIYVNATEAREPATKWLTDLDVTNVAIDPHNGKIFWISKDTGGSGTTYTLNVWNKAEDDVEPIQTSLLSKPTDLEYDRLKDR